MSIAHSVDAVNVGTGGRNRNFAGRSLPVVSAHTAGRCARAGVEARSVVRADGDLAVDASPARVTLARVVTLGERHARLNAVGTDVVIARRKAVIIGNQIVRVARAVTVAITTVAVVNCFAVGSAVAGSAVT